jgi:hypothetical protein
MVSPLISQTVTTINNDTVICLPLSVSKQIIFDLESGDLCADELELIKEDTASLNKKIYYLNDAISLMGKKEESYIKQINTYQQVDSLKTEKIKTLDSKLTTTKNVKNVLIGTSIGLLIISILLIL